MGFFTKAKDILKGLPNKIQSTGNKIKQTLTQAIPIATSILKKGRQIANEVAPHVPESKIAKYTETADKLFTGGEKALETARKVEQGIGRVFNG